MKRTNTLFLRSFFLAGIALICLLVAIPASAQAPTEAGPAFQAYENSFLIQTNGQTFYSTYVHDLKYGDIQCCWGQDFDTYPIEDHIEYARNLSDVNVLSAVVNSEMTATTWDSANDGYETNTGDGYNDDIGWHVESVARAYQLTGNPTFLTQAENYWNFVMSNRNGAGGGWNPSGGIPETNSAGAGSCQLSNSNFSYSGVWLFEATGNQTYLTDAEAIYAWERQHLVNTTGSTITSSTGTWKPWQVIGCTTNPQGGLNDTNSDNVYDAGGVLFAAIELYRVTGTAQYLSDAGNIINHIVGEYNPTAAPPNPIGYNSEDCGCVDNYHFTKGVAEYLTLTNGWATSSLASWLQNTAQDSWNNRDSQNLTWNQWSQPDTDPAPQSMESSSGAAVWSQLPTPTMNLAGTYEIQNVNSGLALNVSGGSTANSAPVIQYAFSSGQKNALWTFVPTSGGYYQIKNVNSGQVLNVVGGNAAGAPEAKIVQFPAQSMLPGNDQWLPVQNSDGTFSFYNLLSKQALNIPGNSTASGTQLDQYFQNGSTGQKFSLIQPGLNLSGTWEIQNTNSGLAVNISGSATIINAAVDQYGFSSSDNAMKWTFVASSAGYYQIKNVNSGLDIAVQNASTTMGAPLIQYTFGSSYNDQWRPVVNSDGSYSFYNANSSQAIDVPGGSKASALQLDQWGENGNSSQTFKLITQ
jgi:hypothetical protein